MPWSFLQRRGRGRAELEFLGERFPQAAGQGFGGKAGARLVLGADGDEDDVRERREVAVLAEFELLFEIAGEIVVARELDRGTERREGLDEDFALHFAAAGAAGDLGEELEGAFAGAEIGHVQGEIGVDDPDQGDVGKVQAFRDHLGADEDVDLAGAKSVERFAVGVFAGHGVGVHSPNDGLGEDGGDVRLHFFGAEAGVDERVFAAFRAALRDGGAVAADVAAQARVGAGGR